MKKILMYVASITIFAITFTQLSLAASCSFYLTGGGNISTAQIIYLTLSVNGSDGYNAVNVNVNFSNLTLLSATPTSGWTPVSGPTSSSTSISFSGGILGGQYIGSKSVLSLSFRAPNSAGKASVSASGSIALANGNGTQISGNSNTDYYTVNTPPPAPTPSPNAVIVNSSTHSDQSQWYNNHDISLSWNKQDGVTNYSYILDQNATTIPSDNSQGLDTIKTYQGIDNGINYFHIKAKNISGWSLTTHFIINIDSNNPDPFTITKIINSTNNQEYILYFATNAAPSGILKYTLNIDNIDKGEQKSGIHIPISSKIVTVTAFSKANNSIKTTLDLTSTNSKATESLLQENVTVTPSIISNVKNSSTLNSSNSFSFLLPILIILLVISILYSLLISLLHFKGIKFKDIKFPITVKN